MCRLCESQSRQSKHPLSGRDRGCLLFLQQRGDRLGQQLCQLRMSLTGQVHMVHLVECSQAAASTKCTPLRCATNRSCSATPRERSTQPSPIAGLAEAFPNGRRRYHQDVGRFAAPAIGTPACCSSRSMPTPMHTALTPKRSFTSLVPSIIYQRSRNSWLFSSGYSTDNASIDSCSGSTNTVVRPESPSSVTR